MPRMALPQIHLQNWLDMAIGLSEDSSSQANERSKDTGMKAALYAKVSSDRQDVDLSISAQLRALREHAERGGHQIVREYVDEAESGRTADRPQFQQMIADARRPSKPFEAVLVWKYSRFARSREDAIVFKSLLRKHGVRVISITEPSEESPTGKLLEAIIESLDEFYSANLAQEVVRGMKEAATRGFWVGAWTPFGYRRVKVNDGRKERPKLEPDPEKAHVVTRIFGEVLVGRGPKEIARSLNGDGIPGPRQKPWTKTTIHWILINETYAGVLVWGRRTSTGLLKEPVRIEGAWPAMVSSEDFKRVKSILQARAPRTTNPRRLTSAYLLSGLLKCGTCGKAMTGQEAKSGKFAYYVCQTLLRRGKGACDAPYLRVPRFESNVVEQIKSRILTRRNLEALVRMANEDLDSVFDDGRERIKTLSAELSDVQKRPDRHYDALESGVLATADVARRIQELRRKQDQLLAAKQDSEGALLDRKQELVSAAELGDYTEDMRRLLDQGTLAERKSFMWTFVREITVKDGQAVIKFALPVPPDGPGSGSNKEPVPPRGPVLASGRFGSPCGIRTRDLRLERAASLATRRTGRLAGDPGFEPGYPDSESGVLPLDESPPPLAARREHVAPS